MDHEQDQTSHPAAVQPSTEEELSFRIILGAATGAERTIARAASPQLALAIFKAAVAEHPDHRLMLRHEGRIIADTAKDG